MSRTTKVATLLALVLATGGCGAGGGEEAAEDATSADVASEAAEAPAGDSEAARSEAVGSEAANAGATAAASDGGEAPTGGGYTVGVEYNTLAVPFVGAVQRGIQEKAEELGVEIIERDPQADTTQQAADIEQMLTQDPDGLIVAGNGEAETLGAVRPAIAADVPIVAMISKIGTQPEPIPQPPPEPPAGGVVAFVAADEAEGGQLAAELVAEALPDGGRIAVVQGATGYSENETRLERFLPTLEETGADYEIVAEQPGDWTPEGGQSACQNMLAANPEIDLFYALSDDMGAGCANAVQQAGGDVQIVGIGGSTAGFAAIEDGSMYGTVWYSPEQLGRDAMQTMVDYLEGEAPDDRYVTHEIANVTADNLDEYEAEW